MKDVIKLDDREELKKEKLVLNTMLKVLQPLRESQRYKLLKCVCDFFGIRLSWD